MSQKIIKPKIWRTFLILFCHIIKNFNKKIYEFTIYSILNRINISCISPKDIRYIFKKNINMNMDDYNYICFLLKYMEQTLFFYRINM